MFGVNWAQRRPRNSSELKGHAVPLGCPNSPLPVQEPVVAAVPLQPIVPRVWPQTAVLQ